MVPRGIYKQFSIPPTRNVEAILSRPVVQLIIGKGIVCMNPIQLCNKSRLKLCKKQRIQILWKF